MAKLKKLFEPINIGTLRLENRLVMLGIQTLYGANDQVTERYRNFLVERARGGVGLIIASIFYPADVGQIGGIGIYHDHFIPGLRSLTDAIHGNGGKVAAQICIQYHWRRDSSVPAEVVAPSAVTTRPGTSPRALTLDEIRLLVKQFGEATGRAQQAGFDAVEFVAGIGYLINRFLSPLTNQRTDEYGGSLENRARFLLEIIDNARRKVGKDYPIICRVSGEEFMKGGQKLEDVQKIASILEQAGIQALNVQAGWHESPVPLIHTSVAPGAFVYLAEGIKKVVNIPVIAAYRISSPALAEEIVAQGKADMVGMARALIADPELPNKARQGRFQDILPCIACCRCLDTIFQDKPMVCSVNPRVGREAEFAIKRASPPKKVFVIGGGVAGMEAARVAALRGHQVTLFEKADRLGGHLLEAAIPPFKSEIKALNDYLVAQVQKGGVDLKLGKEVSPRDIVEKAPDAVIVATGSEPLIPPIPGVEKSIVATALDVLSGRRSVGDRVIVVGGGMVGLETAEFLAQQGKKVTILEMLERLGSDIERVTRWVVVGRIHRAGVKAETKTKVVEITDTGVKASRDGVSTTFEADSVVLAVGFKPNAGLAEALRGKVPAVYSVGDCVEPRKIAQAIEDGFKAALEDCYM